MSGAVHLVKSSWPGVTGLSREPATVGLLNNTASIRLLSIYVYTRGPALLGGG